MMQSIAHRGPDASGTHVDDRLHAYLGHLRLSILDHQGGAQPMWNETGEVGIVFNGEIYNHVELRRQLEQRGHIFKTDHSDTEVLVHGYEEWGNDLPGRLNGMFAFVILDARRNRIFAARDRFGEKPFYYSHKRGFFGFASELRAMSHHPCVDQSLDSKALQKYFAYGYFPAPHSLMRGVRKLPAGHRLSYEIDTGELSIAAYWRFSIDADEGLCDRPETELVDELAHLLQQATIRRMISDVPIGVFLSGGLDSSTVLASLCANGGGRQIDTFTIGFREPSFDESGFASEVAGHFGTKHHEMILDLEAAKALIPEVLSRIDEPLGDASLLPTYMLCRFARQMVTVALSGDGGDELFAGYDPFAALGPAAMYDRIVPPALHRVVRGLAERLPPSTANMSLDFKIKRSLRGLSYPAAVRLPAWMSPLEPNEIAEYFDEPLDVRELYSEAAVLWDESEGKSNIDRAMEFFTRIYLQDDILTKGDRASMLSSLEVRAVFLDNDLVAFCQRLPSRLKYRNGDRKYLLKQVARRSLPSGIVDRRKKGFGVPTAKWLRDFPAAIPQTPVPGANQRFAEQAWLNHRGCQDDHRLFLWSWLSLQYKIKPTTSGVAAYDDRLSCA